LPSIIYYDVVNGEYVDASSGVTVTGEMRHLHVMMSLAEFNLLKAGDAATVAAFIETLNTSSFPVGS
jgi:hypothetical protein